MAGNFELQNLLGSGTFGEAWLARNKTDNSKCVVKVIKIHRLSEKELDQALTEVSVLARCNHVNIIKYQDAFVDEGSLNIVMEYADGGDLHKRIVNQKGIHFGKEAILDLFVQMCFALKYIHSQNILHRDLKTQNIFLTSQNVVKLGDFGIARVLRDSADCALTTIGTPFYLSPEICQKKPYNHKSDMWALGCVLYEMCTLHVPFNAKDFDSLVMKIMTGQFEPLPSHFGTTIRYLCTRLLDKDPNKRLSANETLNFSPLKTFVRRYESKRQIPQLSVRRYSSNSDQKSVRRNSVTSGVKKDGKNEKKGPIKPVDYAMKGKPDNVSRKQSDPLRQIQCQEKVTRRPSIRAEYPSPKKKAVDWMSEKENIDPRRLIGNKTYQVKYPKFRRLSSATPRIKRIVSQQRASLSTEEQDGYKEECARTVLYRNIEKQSKWTSVPVNSSGRENEPIVTADDSVCDDVFGSVDNTQLSFDEYLQMSKENSRRVSNEGSKRLSIDSKFQESIKNIRRSSIEGNHKALNNYRKASVGNNRRHSVGSKNSSEERVSRTSIESRIGSIEINEICKNNGRRSSVETSQKTDIEHKIQRTSVNIKRRSAVEKNSRKVSVSDGCLYAGNSVQDENDKVIRRSNSYDAISSNKKTEENKVHKAGSETYLVTASQSQGSDVKESTSRDNEMIKYINKALYMSLQDFMQSPGTAKTKTFKRLSDIFGEEKLDDILEVCRECLYNHDNYDTFHMMLSETDVLCLPLVFQYLQLEGSQ